jgi:hypothetical protein
MWHLGGIARPRRMHDEKRNRIYLHKGLEAAPGFDWGYGALQAQKWGL